MPHGQVDLQAVLAGNLVEGVTEIQADRADRSIEPEASPDAHLEGAGGQLANGGGDLPSVDEDGPTEPPPDGEAPLGVQHDHRVAADGVTVGVEGADPLLAIAA